MSAWQPIETAPKDKRPILLYDTTETPAEVCVGHHYGSDMWSCVSLQNPEQNPVYAYDFEESHLSTSIEVTHWMPLPEAPA